MTDYVEIAEANEERKKIEGTHNFLKHREKEQEDYKAEKEEIETDMLKMAQGMKHFAVGFKE